MERNSKTLRPYQAQLVTDVLRATGEDVLVEQPTGSGKTLEVVALVGMELGKRFSHAVISAPQEQIENAFVHRDYHSVAFPTHRGVATPAVPVREDLIWGARRSQLGSVKRLLAYLRQRGPLDHALACTHAALNRLTPDQLPADLSGKALFLDEAHHASADGLSQIVTTWRERGGQLYFFTATPYRGDGRAVALDGMKHLRRSLAEHMADRDENGKPYAPGQLDSEIVALGQPGDTVTLGQFTGEDEPPPSYLDGLVEAICHRWRDDGQPKAIVRVPPMRGGSGGFVGRLIRALESRGARVLDATGTALIDKKRFLRALHSEKERAHATSQFEVMVGIQRVLEGTDWPVCSAVYCVGMPGSLNTVVQLLGRAMRPKGDDYPAEQRDRARLVFFVPCGGGSALADLSLDHSRHALLTCCFLADHEVGQEWIVLREVRRGIEAALGPRDENPAAADAENEANAALDPEVRAEVELVMASALEQIISEGREPTLGEVVELAAKTRPDLPQAALQRVVVEILAAQPGSPGAKAREAIHDAIARKLRIDPMVKKAMEEVFAIVLDEFRSVTLNDSPALESVRRQVHGVTGGLMREFAERLREAAPRPLTEEKILGWADAHYEHSGQWPKEDSGPVRGESGENWNAISAALRGGSRGLPGGSSLAKLLSEQRGVRNVADLRPLSIEQILGWADAYRKLTGKWPGQASGPIITAPGETWLAVDIALRQGLRGLAGGSSLARELAENRAARNRKALPPLSTKCILTWAETHRKRTGGWPIATSGAVVDLPGETWMAIDLALRQGLRNLPGGSSLPRLLAEHLSVRNRHGLSPLSLEQILVWADTHRERTGKWPSQTSGPIVEAPEETWRIVDKALRRGSRSLPEGQSLARLLDQHRDVRNTKSLPGLDDDLILTWADAWHRRTGQWPTRKSGAIPEAVGEKWQNIDQALSKGVRKLPGGSSLAQLLAASRGVRNIQALPDLTIERIHAWIDAHWEQTGQLPKASSADVIGAPGEKWVNIDQALRKGLRGLPGGSSLARLINEYQK